MSKLAAVVQAPLIYAKMAEVMRQIGHVEKNQHNQAQNYKFRGIDDMYNALHKPLSDAGVFYIPEVISSKDDVLVKQTPKGESRQIRVKLTIKYTFFAEDGSSISATVEGEAIDSSDKATNKAFSAALKYMLMQVFCIPVSEMDDADKDTPNIDDEMESASTRVAERLNKQTVPVAQERPRPAPSEKPPVHCGAPMLRSQYGPEWWCKTCKAKVPMGKGE